MSDQRDLKSGKLEGPLGHSLVLENIIEAIADGVMVISRQGVISLVNQALCRILGMEAQLILDKGWAELFINQGDNLEFSQTVVGVIQTGEVLHNTQVPYTTPDGFEKSLIATTSLIKDENAKTLGVVAVFKDITQIKELNRRESELLSRSRRLYEERQEGLDRIARAVAHEVRNPVTAIGGLATRLMRKADPKSREAEYYRNMLKAASELEQIVSEVSKYAEIEVRASTPTNLGLWLNDLLQSYLARAAIQKVRLMQELGPMVLVDLDQPLMALAISNLMDNALEAMPQGGELRVELTLLGSRCQISISDSGVGIPADDLPYLFDPFHTTKADRVGMSLANTSRIVFEHQGELEISSEAGKGTICRINLPVSKAQP